MIVSLLFEGSDKVSESVKTMEKFFSVGFFV